MSNRNNGLMTKIWGPPGWLFLHCVTMGYPDKINKDNPEHVRRQKQTKIFFEALGDVMPCKSCRESYLKFISGKPIDDHLSTRVELARWFYDIHNLVNKKLEIEDGPTFKQFYNRYEMFRAGCDVNTEGCIDPVGESVKKKAVIKIVDKDGNDFCLNTSEEVEESTDTSLLLNFIKSWNPEILNLLSNPCKEILLKQTQTLLERGTCNKKKAEQVLKILKKILPKKSETLHTHELGEVINL